MIFMCICNKLKIFLLDDCVLYILIKLNFTWEIIIHIDSATLIYYILGELLISKLISDFPLTLMSFHLRNCTTAEAKLLKGRSKMWL